MIIHIVKPNETIYDISFKYNISVDEIKSANTHFRSWEHLAPGLKIKLPEIPEQVSEEIDLVEPFIEDYYPELNLETFKENKSYEEIDIVETNDQLHNSVNKTKTKNYKNYKYPYYMYYGYPYYRRR